MVAPELPLDIALFLSNLLKFSYYSVVYAFFKFLFVLVDFCNLPLCFIHAISMHVPAL